MVNSIDTRIISKRGGSKRIYSDEERAERKRMSNYRVRVQNRYGISIETYIERIESSDGRCQICEKELVKPYYDHCHKTGEFRGVLCMTCNFGLGHFLDDVELLIKATKYLNDHNEGNHNGPE